eukprot:scaffold145280_cov148-Phaeocystis_antarctica.AAC.2
MAKVLALRRLWLNWVWCGMWGCGVPLCELSVGRLERLERLVERLSPVQVLARLRRSPRATRGRADRRLA